MIYKMRGFGVVVLFTLLLVFSIQPGCTLGEKAESPTKGEIIAGYCAILTADNRGELSEPVVKLFGMARKMVIESLDIKGVEQSWAMGVRSLRNKLDLASDEQLTEDRTKIATLTGKYEPSLKESVCEWERLLSRQDPGKANNYALWEVVSNINEIGESVTSEFYRSLLNQLKQLANTKIPELTEEEKEEKLENTLEEVRVCKESCEFADLQKAFSAAKPGGTIKIESGVYDVNVTIEKNLVIKGKGRDNVKLQGKEAGYPVLTVGSSATVSISGLTVQFALEGEGDDSCASEAKGVCPHGITAKSSAQLDLADVAVRGNWKGVRLTDNATAVVENSSISRNRYYGFHLTGNSSLAVTDSMISEGSVGIYLEDYAVAEIRNSTMEDFGNGFFLWDRSSATVKTCKLARMEFGAFLNDRARIKILDNEIVEVESVTFNTPMFFSGKIEKSGNKIMKEVIQEEEEGDARKPKLEILDWELSRGDNWIWVKGRARNVSGESLVIAEVRGLFYDDQDNLVTTAPTTTVGLSDGVVWSFEISAYVDPDRVVRVDVVEGDCSGGFF